MGLLYSALENHEKGISLLTNKEKGFLLRLARQSLEAAVSVDRMEEPDVAVGPLRERRGAFVSLHRESRLRGCVGFARPVKALYKTVIEAAAAAALKDTRFDPVRPEEISGMVVEISALFSCQQISPEDIQVGVHGLVVSLERAYGVLLPQVAVSANWSPQQFLEETCHKAGLSRDAWQHGATIEAFTAEVFSESSLPANDL